GVSPNRFAKRPVGTSETFGWPLEMSARWAAEAWWCLPACQRTTGIVVDGQTELCGDCQSARTVRRGHCRRHRVSPPPMPQARLTRTDIANLSVYIMSLKRP